jgi:lipoprotein-releasing system ATP-binding protein
MSSPVLELKSVGKTYNAKAANEIAVLRDVSLTIEPGEVVALIAPSGAGKSTLLHIAGLLDQPDSGEIRLLGQDLTRASDRKRTTARRDEIGFVYQFHHLMPEFTALQNVILPQSAAGVSATKAAARARSLLTTVGLASRLDHRPAELSGGEQQRVAVCRSLANAPSLLLADEPTGNLDPTTSAEVFDMLMKLARETGLSALIATHNWELAQKMDRCVELKDGRLQPPQMS